MSIELYFKGTPHQFCQFLDSLLAQLNDRYPAMEWHHASGSFSFQQKIEIPEWAQRLRRQQVGYGHPEYILPKESDSFTSTYVHLMSESMGISAMQIPDNLSLIRTYKSMEIDPFNVLEGSLENELNRLGFLDTSRAASNPLNPWEKIPDFGWDRDALRLWWDKKTASQIGRELHPVKAEQTVLNKIAELRRQHGTELVPIRRKK